MISLTLPYFKGIIQFINILSVAQYTFYDMTYPFLIKKAGNWETVSEKFSYTVVNVNGGNVGSNDKNIINKK